MTSDIVLISYTSPVADKAASDLGNDMPLGPVPPSFHLPASSLATSEMLQSSRFSGFYDLNVFTSPRIHVENLKPKMSIRSETFGR